MHYAAFIKVKVATQGARASVQYCLIKPPPRKSPRVIKSGSSSIHTLQHMVLDWNFIVFLTHEQCDQLPNHKNREHIRKNIISHFLHIWQKHINLTFHVKAYSYTRHFEWFCCFGKMKVSAEDKRFSFKILCYFKKKCLCVCATNTIWNFLFFFFGAFAKKIVVHQFKLNIKTFPIFVSLCSIYNFLPYFMAILAHFMAHIQTIKSTRL